MALRINPFHQLTWNNPHSLQIGTDFRSVTVDRVSPPQERFIDALYYGISRAQLPAVAKQIHLSPAEADQLLGQLTPLLFESTDAQLDGHLGIGVRAQASLDNSSQDCAVIARRQASVVEIVNLDATGLGLLLALAASGVGTLISPDTGKVSEEDCSSNLYPRALLGYQRFQAAKLILDSSWPGARVVSSARVFKSTPRPGLTVMVNHQATPAEEVGRLRTLGRRVLEIRYHATGFEVSPVLDLASACLLCREHYLQDADPSHLVRQVQLLDSQLRFDDAGSRMVGSGLAIQQILRCIDGSETPAVETGRLGFRYNRLPDVELRTVEWLAHPECSCRIGQESIGQPLVATGS